MTVDNKRTRNILALCGLILAYVGFRFVTQAGQSGVVIQNDGYAVTGGILIFAGGMLTEAALFFSKGKK